MINAKWESVVMGGMRRWWPMLGVAGLLLASAMAASGSGLVITRVEPAGVPPPADSLLPTQPPPDPHPSPRANLELVTDGNWFTVAAGALGTVAVLIIAAFMIGALWYGPRFRRRSLRVQVPASRTPQWVQRFPEDQEDLVAALDAGLVALDDTGADPRRAVIACWLRLEQAAAQAGVPREPGDTSTDLVMRLLRQHALSEPVLTDLAQIYRQARYASQPVDISTREHAQRALRRLREELIGDHAH